MKTKGKESSAFDAVKDPATSKHSHYFHADEDFREDRDWGKTNERSNIRDGLKVNKKETKTDDLI
ncbi:hypothetical protein [Pedobacter sp. V48]|uniref:hypothetical protein n=1 Tax=Pedobacter sp. V48 TaxID=509635 RepID=UPI0003E46A0A|nr:hypothetical protein [Pedobacter sp. V48]ETZ23067.1 hypothetical protein N824_20740 [Pedobacter sp. V48]